MTDIYERLADENDPAPTTAPAAQFTGGRASDLMASLMAEDADATAILTALAARAARRAMKNVRKAYRNASVSRPRGART